MSQVGLRLRFLTSKEEGGVNSNKSLGKRCVQVSFRMAVCALKMGTAHVEHKSNER